MNHISINEDLFWKWMDPAAVARRFQNDPFRPESNKDHLILLSQLMKNRWDSVALGFNEKTNLKSANTLDKLSRQVPRRYFLEIQYCLAAYVSVFASIFPPMISHLDNLAYIEWLLYMEPDYEKYRDHLVHMFRVAFMCNQLMRMNAISEKAKNYQFSSKHFLSWCKNIVSDDPQDWDDSKKGRLLDAAIYLAAIFHDFGYGHFFLFKYRQRLSGVLPSLVQSADPVDIHHRGSIRLRKSLAGNFVKHYHSAFEGNQTPTNEDVILSGFFRDCLCLNHSVASAMFIIDLAEQLRNSNAIGDELYIAFHLAAEAAMLHDMTKDGKWLYLKPRSEESFLCCKDHREVPLLALLVFADEIELGSRSIIHRQVKDQKCIYAVKNSRRHRLKIKYDESKNCLNLESDNPACLEFLAEQGFFSNSCICSYLLDVPLHTTEKPPKKSPKGCGT